MEKPIAIHDFAKDTKVITKRNGSVIQRWAVDAHLQ